MRSLAILLIFALSFARVVAAQIPTPRIKPPKKEKEPETQTLPLPPEPPAVVVAETGKLVFHISPLSNKGLLTQQVHDALRALDRANGDATFVKMRAFVAGTGDLRRVATIVSEELADKKTPIPAVTTIQVGALPMEGAQVVIESISADKKTMNPNGLALFAERQAQTGGEAIQQLAAAAHSAGATMLEVTCYVSTLDQLDAMRAGALAVFPGAAVNFVQPTRLAMQSQSACEGVGRAAGTPQSSDGVALATNKVLFTGMQMAFGSGDTDLRLAFDRLGKALEVLKARYSDALAVSFYSLDASRGEKAKALASQFLGASAHALSSIQVVEGLPSLDAQVGIEVVAAGP